MDSKSARACLGLINRGRAVVAGLLSTVLERRESCRVGGGGRARPINVSRSVYRRTDYTVESLERRLGGRRSVGRVEERLVEECRVVESVPSVEESGRVVEPGRVEESVACRLSYRQRRLRLSTAAGSRLVIGLDDSSRATALN